MEINKEITVTLTPKDLEKMIIEHLKSEGINVKSVYFSVNGYNREDDWRAEYPLDYRLDKAVCKGVESNDFDEI